MALGFDYSGNFGGASDLGSFGRGGGSSMGSSLGSMAGGLGGSIMGPLGGAIGSGIAGGIGGLIGSAFDEPTVNPAEFTRTGQAMYFGNLMNNMMKSGSNLPMQWANSGGDPAGDKNRFGYWFGGPTANQNGDNVALGQGAISGMGSAPRASSGFFTNLK